MENKEISDDRFAHISRDPRFRRPRKVERKVKIDKRFEGMFTDQQFKVKYSVDKRGKPVRHTSKENLERFYELSDDDSDGDDDDKDDAEVIDEAHSKRLTADAHGDDNNDDDVASGTNETADDDAGMGAADSDADSDDESAGIGSGPDLARGDGNVTTSDEEEEDDDDNDAEEESSIEHGWGEHDKAVPVAADISHRLAICNMNWDRIKARDLFVILNSFKPSKGSIYSVKIYPSEYGLARMQEEHVTGPKEIIESQIPNKGDNSDDESRVAEGQSYHREKLRLYQLNRLKYYYAVADCDSAETANHIYEQCDGLEYETSASTLDLRFIPDDMTFDQDPTSICTDQPETALYKPPTFLTTALCQSKVDLTWDETDRERSGLTTKHYTKGDIKELDFQAYLASSSDDEGEDEKGDAVCGYEFELPLINDDEEDVNAAKAATKKASRQKDSMVERTKEGATENADNDQKLSIYKSLVNDGENVHVKSRDQDMEMQVTWEPGLRDVTEKLIKKKGEKNEPTPWEEFLQKKKEKKKEKKQKKKLDKSSEDPNSISTDTREKKSIAKKSGLSRDSGKGDNPESGEEAEVAFSDDDVPEGIDMTDPFFAEELVGHQTSAKAQKDAKKKKKRKAKQEELSEIEKEELSQNKAELSLLMMEGQEDGRQHFNLKDLVEGEKKRKSKKRRRKQDKEPEAEIEDTFALNVADPRFDAVYSSYHYNIDPTAPEFKKTKGMDTIIEEKLKRRKDESDRKLNSSVIKLSEAKAHKNKSQITLPESNIVEKVKDPSISSLVKSVKLKTQQYHSRKKLK